MKTRSLSTFFALALSPALLSSCNSQEEQFPADDYPLVEGLPVAEDQNPEPNVAEYELVVDESDVELLEGLTTRMWTYNGTSPGPLLQAKVGDTVRVHVTNNLAQPTSIHWHGVRVPYQMDGVQVPGVYPIGSGESFTYEFVVPDAGTFWYHPHVAPHVQVEAGLYGALVVHEEEDLRPDVDADRVILLDDILLEDDGSIAEATMEHHTQMHGRAGNYLLTNGKTELERVTLAEGGAERWRLVNVANSRTMDLQFPGLEVRLIASDAGLWKQDWTRSISELSLPVGARAELEVRLAEDATEGGLGSLVQSVTAWGTPFMDELEIVPVSLDTSVEAVSRAGHDSNPSYALPDADADSEVDKTLRLDVEFDDNNRAIWTIEGLSYPDYENWTVDVGELQVIELRNQVTFEFPFHFHGILFTILSRNGQAVDEPGLRDTVMLNGNSSVVIAAEFTEPGYWLYHSSLLEYAELGMAGLVEVRE